MSTLSQGRKTIGYVKQVMTPSSTASSYYTIQLTYTQPVNVGIDIINKVDEYEGMRDIMSELRSSGYFSIRTLE
ncbi:MAG TPA: hypothetical protein PK404_01705 [Fervidobacterium sp.]|nr:hypothetical protein [Fervidobacterium sp.]HOM73724.1 hypothetical protein [Fervidobacterium sp.]HPP17501.1 hypothetical protein [Fervidobacterium sp.]